MSSSWKQRSQNEEHQRVKLSTNGITFALDDIRRFLKTHKQQLNETGDGQCQTFYLQPQWNDERIIGGGISGTCLIGDLNRDGQLEAFVDCTRRLYSKDIQRTFSLYGEEKGKIVPYLVMSHWDCEPYSLPDGRYCFANKIMIWQRKALCWENGDYIIKRQEITAERSAQVRDFVRAIFHPLALLWGLSPALLLFFLFLQSLRSKATDRKKIRLAFFSLTIILAVLAGFVKLCYLHGYESVLGYAIGATILPLFTAVVLYGFCIRRILVRPKDLAE